MKIGILASAVGLAVSAVAIAEALPASQDFSFGIRSVEAPRMQLYKQTGFPVAAFNQGRIKANKTGLQRLQTEQVEAEATFRGGAPNPIVAELDYNASWVPVNVSLAPSFVGPPSFQSGDLPPNFGFQIDGSTSVAAVRVIDPVVNAATTPAPPVGPNGVSNNTKMIRHLTPDPAPGTTWGLLFLGSFTDLIRDITAPIGTREFFPLAPTASNDARAQVDVYNTGTADLATFETSASFTGFIGARILWGFNCSETTPGDGSCDDFGGPGPLTEYFSLGPDPTSFETGIFVASAACQSATGVPTLGCTPPPGISVGDPVPVVVGMWHQMAGVVTSDGFVVIKLNRLDGTGEFDIYRNTALTSTFIDGWSANMGRFVANEANFFDNAHFAGEPFLLPIPPDFTCPYFDDYEWLNPGPVLGQTQRLFIALSAGLTAVVDGAHGQVLQQRNVVASNFVYRDEFAENTPRAIATAGNPWQICVEARTTGATQRGFALRDTDRGDLPGGIIARLYIGYENPNDPMNPFFDNGVYVQINPAYDPIDEQPTPVGVDPVDNVATINTDIVDTGFNWTVNTYREICFTIDIDNNMTISIAGATIGGGLSPFTAFGNSMNSIRFESENSANGVGATLRVDNLDFACGALPQVTLPALTVPYLDDAQWGVAGIAPERHIDDPVNFPFFSTRYTNAPGVVMAVENLIGNGSSTVFAMSNVFRDTTQPLTADINDENFAFFQQMFTDVAPVEVDASTRWVLEMDWAMSDFLTSRGFSPAQGTPSSNLFNVIGFFWYHAPDDSFYVFASPENATPEDALITIPTNVTLSSLGVLPNQVFTVGAQYNLDTDMIDWTVNGNVIASSHPVVGQQDGVPVVATDLSAVFFWGGDDDTASADPLSTLFVDNISVTTGGIVCPGDTDGNNVINFLDLNAVLSTFGQSGMGLPGDVDGNGVVNFLDLNTVLSNFGVTCN